MFVNIEDYTEEWFDMNAEDELVELNPWFILNANEIGASIAYEYFDAEYDITQEYLDESINDFLSNIHEQILEIAIQKLEENNKMVY